MAIRLDRAAPIWFAFGAILGPTALLLLRAAPPGRCRTCATPTRGWLRVCGWCREDVTTTPATTLAIVARMAGPAEPSEVPQGREPSKQVEPDAIATRVLATAVHVTGSMHLEPGRRYSIAVHGSRLQILGPTDIDPSTIVLDRPLGEIDASAVGDRLIFSEPRSTSGLSLAFMSVAGSATDHLADMIREAARESIQP